MLPSGDGSELLKKKTLLLIQREKEFFALQQKYGRAMNWLTYFGQLASEIALHQGLEEIYEKWISATIRLIGFQAAIVCELRPETSELIFVTWMPPKAICDSRPLVDPTLMGTFVQQQRGICNDPSESFRAFAKLTKLDRFMWYQFPIDNNKLQLFVAGFGPNVAAVHPPFYEDDLRSFSMVGQHMEAVFHNVRLLDQLEAEKHRLIEVSRRAGMAEIAIGVLHNVKNVLNSVLTASGLIKEKIIKSKLSGLQRVVDLIHQHRDDLGTFFAEDPKGKLLPEYFEKLASYLEHERVAIGNLVNDMTQNIDHIKNIVERQQTYAQISSGTELCTLDDIVEDAFKINQASLLRHKIIFEYESALIPPVFIERQHVLQILVNLISNAKNALVENESPRQKIFIRTRLVDLKTIHIEVQDTGIGISPENLPLLFNHGFTTRKDGHGFGLHSCAYIAKRIGGSLSVYSDGIGKGAVFLLEIPIEGET